MAEIGQASNATSNDTICQICLHAKSKYTCPRCNASYCSLSCYQSEKHVQCSDSFYKDWVLEELKDRKIPPEERQKVLEMLKKEQENDAEENFEDEEEDLVDRLDGLDLDKDISIVWGRLTCKEKEEFARMFQDGRLSRLIDIWTPWWMLEENHKLVKAEKSKGFDNTCVPPLLSDIPDINILLKNSKPSSDCKYDVINVLLSYAFVTRTHNGCHHDCPVDSTTDFLDVCHVLANSKHYSTVGESLQTALDCVSKNGSKSCIPSSQFTHSLIDDVLCFISGPGKRTKNLEFMLAVLSDTVTLFRSSFKIVRKETKSSSELSPLKSRIFAAEKKALFLLSWLQRYGMCMHDISPLIRFEKETRVSAAEDIEELKTCVEQNMDKLKPKDATDEQVQIHSKIIELL